MDWRGVRRISVDLTLVFLAAAIGIARELEDPNLATKLVVAPVAVYVALQAVAAAALWWRRDHPCAAAVVIAVATIFAPNSAVFLIPYALTRYGERRGWVWPVLGGLTVAWLIGARAWAIDDPFSGLALIAVSTVLGLYVRARRRLYDELVERADRAERERDLLAERARAEERVRLAGEMHDVVTHRISLMVLQAGALEVTSDRPEVRQATQELREHGVQALAELRDLVGVLRTGERASGADPPRAAVTSECPAADVGIDQSPAGVAAERGLAALVDESRAVGLDVELRQSGEAAATAPTVRRALYRVVQESLTNVHKHAPGSHATVEIVYAAHRVEVDVRNTAPAARGDPALAEAGSGVGLAGLRQRIEMLGGRLSALPGDDGGFHVSAQLPAFVPTHDTS